MQDIIRDHTLQIGIINRAVTVAVDNVKLHLSTMQSRFAETKTWAQQTLENHTAMLNDWQGAVDTLRGIPANDEFGFLLRRRSTPTKRSNNVSEGQGALRGFITLSDITGSATQASDSSKAFGKKLTDVDRSLKDIASDTAIAVEEVENSPSEPLSDEDIANIFEEAETFAKKINSDYEHILRLPDNSKSLANTSRMALGHTRDFLPSLKAVAQEIDQAVKTCIQTRNAAVRSAIRNMQNISVIESGLASIQSQMQSLDLDVEGVDAFDTLDIVFRLPTAYGSVLVESIRRNEWDEKVKADSASLAEEMALYKDEEQRRRRKWVKTMVPFIDDAQEIATTEMEVNLRGASNEWPRVSRDDLDIYLDDLRKNGVDDALEEVTKMVRELDSPTKQQKKRAKAFKNGSVYDAGLGLGRSSLLMRGEDDSLKSLKDENVKLSDKLKASESRVRKLEAMIHRDGPLSRPLSGTFGVPPADFERHVSSPVAPSSPKPAEILSRRSSVSSRRTSSNQTEENKLARRIVRLEAELMQERDTVTKLQREAHAERRSSTESRDRMNEAESTKKDLMANLEAQRQEFEDERQLLEDEVHKMKIRLEEAEDELDQVVGSRDQEKAVSEKTLRELQSQLDQAMRTGDYDRQKAQDEIASLESDLASQRERLASLDKQLQELRDEKSSSQGRNLEMANELRDLKTARDEHVMSLQAAHSQLSPDGIPPDDLGRLVHAIEILSEGLAIHARGSDEVAQLVSAENKSLEARIERMEKDKTTLKDDIASKEAEMLHVQELLAEEKNKLASLHAELAKEQIELKELRDKFATGETGSEALKRSVAEEQQRVTELTETLASAQARSKSTEQETQLWKDRLEEAKDQERQLKLHFDSRAARCKDLSQKLFSQNDRMIRVMEQMGYSITRQDGELVIQRASKVNASTTLLPSAPETPSAAPMNRSLSGALTLHHFSEAADLELLYWTDSDAVVEDNKFQAFIDALSRLDLDTASDLVAKRYKDVETLARKWQRESRAYREKYHRAQSEAHEKIAYRSFKDGDLALFLPTRNQATRPWAAFNVGAPHYFLREHDSHKLQTRDWLLARISKVEERIVDLSRAMNTQDRRSLQAETSDAGSMRSVDDENPFELSDGLRWYMIDAFEEKPGAPTTPGLGKSTVASTNIDARGSIQLTKEKQRHRDSLGAGNAATATKNLSKSLDSRRSSSGSKKGMTAGLAISSATGHIEPTTSGDQAQQVVPDPPVDPETPAREDDAIFEQVRKDLLFGP